MRKLLPHMSFVDVYSCTAARAVKTAIAMLVFAAALGSAAAQPAHPVLNPDDVDHFCATFPQMFREYKALGLNFNQQTGAVHGLQQLKQAGAVAEILERHGWTMTFFPKMKTIVRGFALEKYEQVMREHGEKMERAVRRVRDSKWVRPNRKEQIRERYLAKKNQLEQMARKLRAELHPQDREQVRSQLGRLERVFKKAKRVSD